MELFVTAFMAICAGVIGVVFVLVGALLVGAGLATLRETWAARGWPQVFAVIESSSVEPVTRPKGTMYRPLVRYAYGTATGNFTARRISFAERLYGSEAAARKVADRYMTGTTVVARCNPDDPSAAVLVVRWLDGAGILLFGLLCWVFPAGAATAAGVPWPVSASVLFALLAIPAILSLRLQKKVREARRAGLYPPPGSGSDEQVAMLMERGEKILAIRLYRELHGGGLKEAREAVEALPSRQSSGVTPDAPL